MKIVLKNQLKVVIFTAVKNRCMLHGPVFVMRVKMNKYISRYQPLFSGLRLKMGIYSQNNKVMALDWC